MKRASRIVSDPKIMLCKPVIRGTRVPVEILIRKMSEGVTTADLLDASPRLTESDLRAALAYAANALAHEAIIVEPRRRRIG